MVDELLCHNSYEFMQNVINNQDKIREYFGEQYIREYTITAFADLVSQMVEEMHKNEILSKYTLPMSVLLNYFLAAKDTDDCVIIAYRMLEETEKEQQSREQQYGIQEEDS